MGDDDQRPEERAAHRVTVAPFRIDRHEVTNAQFERFVDATGYHTVAERGLPAEDHPGLPPELLAPGAVVFATPDGLLDLVDVRTWWRYVAGADWRHPAGPGSSIEGKGNHPVVNIAYEDAAAYARWLGRELPTEAQWEFAARGGLDGATYGWGEDYYDPAAGWRANTWQGVFPLKDNADDGHRGTAPVGSSRPTATACSTCRERLGIHRGLVGAGPSGAGGRRPGRPAARTGRQLRWPRRASGRDQGRLVPVRAQLLRPLPAVRPTVPGARPGR